jgi:hypothetical protein
MFENVWVVTMHGPVNVIDTVVFRDEVKAHDFWEIMNATSSREVHIDKSHLV